MPSLRPANAGSRPIVNASLNNEDLLGLIDALHVRAAAARHRGVLVLSGDAQWCRDQLMRLLPWLDARQTTWVGSAPSSVSGCYAPEQATGLIGGECEALVWDAHAGLDANGLGAAAGTLCAGGVLLLLTPPLNHWGAFDDPQHARLAVHPYTPQQVSGHFLRRLGELLARRDTLCRVEQDHPLPPLPTVPPQTPAPVPVPAADGSITADQAQAIEALHRVVHGHRHRPLVLIADRGRGKSVALGLAAAGLLCEAPRRIVVTAPRPGATTTLFTYAARRLGVVTTQKGRLQAPNGGELCFVAPDQLLHERPSCDLLLVDEAAAIPAPMLESMLEHYPRMAFATTVHGYEGTGRGFELRFQRLLTARCPQWRELRLQEPVRWAEGDPLEQLIFEALLLDAEPADETSMTGAALSRLSLQHLSGELLVEDEQTLRELFGLLVLAHYRTTPNDLRNLLDGPNLEIFLLRHQNHVAAVLLLAREGGIDPTLGQQVYEGQRRLRGHLLPQSLATHAGLRSAPSLRGGRIMRIAVHPAHQREGWGRHLVAQVATWAQQSGYDYLGSSFGASPELLDFWQETGMRPVRLGLRREASSGMHAMLLMVPLSSAGEGLLQEARARLLRHLPAQLGELLQDVETVLIRRVLSTVTIAEARAALLPLCPEELEECRSYALAGRDYAGCLAALQRLVWWALLCPEVFSRLGSREGALLIGKLLQRRNWHTLVTELGFCGRGEAERELREICAVLYRQYLDGEIQGPNVQ